MNAHERRHPLPFPQRDERRCLAGAASEQAPRVCQGAMGVCGIVGFKNDTPFSVGRHLRDTMSASLMVANERIHQTNASLLLIAQDI